MIGKITIQVPIGLTEQFFEDIICTMFEGGSNYWIDHVKADQSRTKGIPTSTWVSNLVNGGETVFVFPQEDDKGYPLTKEKLIVGLQTWMTAHPGKVPMTVEDGETTIDAGNLDGDDADAILQYALFGELVYG
jgi:hypothetical protein